MTIGGSIGRVCFAIRGSGICLALLLGAGSVSVVSMRAMAEVLVAEDLAAQEPAQLTGNWEGAVTTPGGKLEFLLRFISNTEGSISIPVQKVKDVPLEKITLDSGASPAKATFKIKQVSGIGGDPTFSGTFNEDGSTISGDFTQGGGKFPFEIRRGKDDSKAKADVVAGLDEFFAKAVVDWNVPGMAVAIVKGGEVIYAKGFGFRDVEKKLPVTENTLFPIGSATKAFTTFVMGQLADEGKLEFDTPVITYLPEFRLYDVVATERLTPRDLVTHRSGLPRHDLMWVSKEQRPRADMVRRLAYLPNNKDVRVAWQYNNLMFLTAGFMEERLTGKSWEENIRERILLPLGMKRTTLNNTDSQKDANFAFGYREKEEGDGTERMDFRDITTMGPAGSINSSVVEMANWVKLNLADGEFGDVKLIKASTLRELHAPQMTMGGGSPDPEVVSVGYAMGWFVDVYRGKRRLHHGGNIDGFSAMTAFLPREDAGVIVLTNMNGTGLPEMMARHVFDRLLGVEGKDWNGAALAQRAAAKKQAKEGKAKLAEARKQGTHPSHPISDYVGKYEHPGYGVIAIAMDGSSSEAALQFTYNGIVTPLEHWHYDVFSGKRNEQDRTFESFKLVFETGLDGEIGALRAPMETSMEPLVFKRLGDDEMREMAYLKKLVGEFAIDSQKITFSLAGSVLTASVPGQPTYQLEPMRKNTFRIKEVPGFSLQFVPGDSGTFDEVKVINSSGVFTAKRVDGPRPDGEK